MPRADAKLKTLPLSLQEQLWRLRSEPHDADGLPCDPADGSSWTQERCRKWLEDAHGVSCSAGSFSDWERWFPQGRDLLSAKETASLLEEAAKDGTLDYSSEQIMEIGNKFFSAMAIRQRDPKAFLGFLKEAGKTKARELDERRVRLLEEKAAKADAASDIMENDQLSDEERGQRLREIFGIGA